MKKTKVNLQNNVRILLKKKNNIRKYICKYFTKHNRFVKIQSKGVYITLSIN